MRAWLFCLGNTHATCGAGGVAERDGAKLTDASISQNSQDVLQQAEELANQALVSPQAQRHENGAAPPAQDEQAQQPSYWSTQLFTVAQFLERPPKQWLVQNVLGVQDMALLFGEPGSGKTFVAFDLAFSLATGRQWAGSFPVTRPLTVAYCTSEGIGGMADRLRAATAYYATQDVPLFLFTDAPQLFERSATNGVSSFVRDWQDMARAGRVPTTLDVLMVDTLHGASTGADENSAQDAGIILSSLRHARDTLGCAPILVHHANKQGKTERGSTALRGAMDCVLRAEKSGVKEYALKVEKLKDGSPWSAKIFELEPVEDTESVRVLWKGDAMSSATSKDTQEQRLLAHLLQNAGVQYTAADLALALYADAGKASNVGRTLRDMASAGSVQVGERMQQAGAVKKGVKFYFVADSV